LNGVDSVNDRVLVRVNVKYCTSSRAKHNNTHSSTEGTEGVKVGKILGESLHVSERASVNRTRLIKHQDEINQFTALLLRTSFANPVDEAARFHSTDVSKLDLLSIREVSTARTVCVSPHSNNIARRLGVTSASSTAHNDRGRVGSSVTTLLEEDVHGFLP